MPDYLLLMHDDRREPEQEALWGPYFQKLREGGGFDGGSSIGAGESLRQGGEAAAVTTQLTGYIRIRVADMAEARAMVAGNPVFEAGGTVEIRELPQD